MTEKSMKEIYDFVSYHFAQLAVAAKMEGIPKGTACDMLAVMAASNGLFSAAAMADKDSITFEDVAEYTTFLIGKVMQTLEDPEFQEASEVLESQAKN